MTFIQTGDMLVSMSMSCPSLISKHTHTRTHVHTLYIALFPCLPHFCALVWVDNNNYTKQKSSKKWGSYMVDTRWTQDGHGGGGIVNSAISSSVPSLLVQTPDAVDNSA